MENFGLSSIEKSEKIGKPYIERPLKKFRTEKTTNSLREAQKALVNNEILFKKYLNGISDKFEEQWGEVSNLASIENIFVAYCVNLSNEEIENLVFSFNKNLLEYLRKNKGIISSALVERIHQDKSLRLDSRGIKSVIEYIRERKKFFDSEPVQQHGFFYEDILDARHKIDLMECIYEKNTKGEVSIHTMNLIQVKSGVPTEKEKEKIIGAHEGWLRSSVMDWKSFNREYKDGLPDGVAIETLLENVEEVGELFLDMCTDPRGFDPNVFISRLNLEKLSNKHKAWLLLEYGGKLKFLIINSRKNKKLTEEGARAIMDAIQNLEDSVKKEMAKLKNFSKIKKINSIIAVGGETISMAELPSSEDSPYIVGTNYH